MARRKQSASHHVFLSHSTKDRWICERMKEKMEEVGATVWMDSFDIPGGTNILDRIRQALESSTECLILLSPASQNSEWVRHEAGMADGLRLAITFVLLHIESSAIPVPLQGHRHFMMNDFADYVMGLKSKRTPRKPPQKKKG